jgi:hypothetical protein
MDLILCSNPTTTGTLLDPNILHFFSHKGCFIPPALRSQIVGWQAEGKYRQRRRLNLKNQLLKADGRTAW